MTGTSLANNAAREGTLVDNTSNLYMDAILSGFVTVGAAAATGNCYVLLSSSDATTVSYPATGSNASIVVPVANLGALTLGQIVPGTALVFLYTIGTMGVAATTAVGFENLSVAQAFGGNLPPKWAPVLVNCQGQSFDATAGHTVINYNGVTYTTA